MNFIPQFDADVYVYGPSGAQHMNPRLYATQLAAYQMVDLLSDLNPTIVMQWPWTVAPGSPFTLSKKVPFLRLPSGYTENAGAYMMFWAQQPDAPDIALRYCKAQILADQAAWLADQQAAQQQQQ